MMRMLGKIILSICVAFILALLFDMHAPKVQATHVGIHRVTHPYVSHDGNDRICWKGPTSGPPDYSDYYIGGPFWQRFPNSYPERSFKLHQTFNEGADCGQYAGNITADGPWPSGLPQTGDLELWTADPCPTYCDVTPPTQSNITAGSITQTGATITWTTNESTTNTIKYGPVSGYYDSYPNTKSAGTGTSASGAL